MNEIFGIAPVAPMLVCRFWCEKSQQRHVVHIVCRSELFRVNDAYLSIISTSRGISEDKVRRCSPGADIRHDGPVVSGVLQHHVSKFLSFEVVDAVVSKTTMESSWNDSVRGVVVSATTGIVIERR